MAGQQGAQSAYSLWRNLSAGFGMVFKFRELKNWRSSLTDCLIIPV